MIRALIVDDEAPGVLALRTLLDPLPGVEVIGEARNLKEACRRCASARPDVLFLDIHLRGESGFDLLERLAEPWPRIVFVTAYDRYAVRAFETNALDYLLKPVEPERLEVTLDRIRNGMRPEAVESRTVDRVLVKSGNQIRWIPWAQVRQVRADGNYTVVDVMEEGDFVVGRPLKEWVAQAPPGFLQVHRRHLVNVACVLSVEALSTGARCLSLEDGGSVPVGRNYWPGLRQAMNGDRSV